MTTGGGEKDDLQATIEELRAVNEELQATNEELRTALDDVARLHARLTLFSELAFDGILVVDARSLAVLEANRAATELFGVEAHELTRAGLTTLVVPGDAKVLLEAVGDVQGGAGRSLVVHVRKAGGGEVPVRIAIAAVEFDRAPLLHCTLQDLSDRNQLQSELSAAQGVLRGVFDALPVGLLVLGRDPAGDEANARIAAIAGVAGGAPRDVHRRLAADWPGFERATEGAWGGATTSLRGALRGDGPPVEVFARVFPVLDGAGAVERVGVVLEDRSAETALQRRMTAIFDAIDDAVVVTDANDRVVAWNAGAERIYGYAFGAAVGARVEELLRPVQTLARTAPTEPAAGALTGRVIHRHRDGSPVEVDFVVRSLTDHDGTIEGRVAVYRPRRVAVDLDVQLLRAERLHGLGTLAAGIAHEFNNLLGAVLANCSFLAAQLSGDPELLAAVTSSTEAARRGADLTRQMLALAQGRSDTEGAAEVGAVLRSVGRLVGTGHGDLDVRVEVPQGSVLARADSTQLRQCVLNLALNAKDAMRNRGLLRLLAERGEGEVRIHVDDSGPGVPEALRTQIFDPFFTTKPPGEGTGLGLALVHALVERWQGTVTVGTAPHGGARFTITVPTVEARPSERQTAPPSGQPPRLALVIDDEPAVRAGTTRLLRMLGIETLVASRGEEGLSMLATTPVDLVLVDVVMPDMQGDEVYRRIRLSQPALPVLFVSGYAADRLGDVLEHDPHARFLGKPFDVHALSAEVGLLLGGPSPDDAPEPSR